MVNEFTFIVLAYNHEDYIVDHLESMKSIIEKYAEGVSVDLIVSDDCSKDDTVNLAKQWIEKNKALFRNSRILVQEENKGIINSIFESVQYSSTRYGKYLAGDDLYGDENIFDLIEDALVLTPVAAFGGDEVIRNGFGERFKYLLTCKNQRDFSRIMKIDNFIPAPGAFFPLDYLRDQGLKEFLKGFRNIEDYPMFYYFIVKKEYPTKVITKKYIKYRIGNGISTNTKPSESFRKEQEFLYEYLNLALYKKLRYFNIKWYYKKWIQFKANFIKIDF